MGQILRQHQVAVEGRYTLQPDGQPTSPSATGGPETGGAQVRLVETRPDYSVLEVVCSCGQTMHVRCDHA